MKLALVTGSCGFVGTHLTRALIAKDYKVTGLYYNENELNSFPDNLNIDLLKCDITQKDAIEKTLKNRSFDVVFHLAGIAHVPSAEGNLEQTFKVNTIGTGYLLNIIKDIPNCKFIYISSSEVYERSSSKPAPYIESSPILPSNVYGITKSASEQLCAVYSKKWNMKNIIFRPFNHIGPGQSPLFVASDFAKQIAMIEKGLINPKMSVGNLNAMRDFSDVRDVVRGYISAAESVDHNETINICSGKAVRISDLLDILLSFSDSSVEITADPKKMRKCENPVIFGSHKKMSSLTDWEPRITLWDSLKDILNYWRKEV